MVKELYTHVHRCIPTHMHSSASLPVHRAPFPSSQYPLPGPCPSHHLMPTPNSVPAGPLLPHSIFLFYLMALADSYSRLVKELKMQLQLVSHILGLGQGSGCLGWGWRGVHSPLLALIWDLSPRNSTNQQDTLKSEAKSFIFLLLTRKLPPWA